MHQITFLKLDNILILWKRDHAYHDTIKIKGFYIMYIGHKNIKKDLKDVTVQSIIDREWFNLKNLKKSTKAQIQSLFNCSL